jgi:hypothetical protein
MNPRAPEVVLKEVEQTCRTLVERGGELLTWEWDDSFPAALCVVKSPRDQELLALVEELLPVHWDHESIRQAPRRILELSGARGGLRPGQKLLTTEPADDPLLFAAWWPWGGGTTFSLRVGCVAAGAAAEALQPEAVMRACLGV